MDQNYLELLESIRNTLEEIKDLEAELNIADPAGYLDSLTEIRNALEDVLDLRTEVSK